MRNVSIRGRAAPIAVALIAIAADHAPAQVKIESKALEIGLTGRLHTQFNTTSVDDEVGSEFLIRRARFTAEVKLNDLVSGKIQPDYGEGEITLKDAYVRLTFDRAFRATMGQFKRPFDLFELTSSTQILVIERAGGIRGVNACSGPGGVCSLSRFTERLEYSDRDIGLLIDGGDRRGRLQYMASVTNGTGANDPEENGRKSYGGRVEVTARPNLTVAGNIALHDYVNAVGADDDWAVAFGADLEWGSFESGLHVQAGLVAGDNWRNLDGQGNPSGFLTAQGIVTYKRPRGSRLAEAIEPVGRISWGDPDTDADDDAGWLFTPGFVVHFVGRNKVAVNIDIWSPSAGDSEWSFKAQSYLHF